MRAGSRNSAPPSPRGLGLARFGSTSGVNTWGDGGASGGRSSSVETFEEQDPIYGVMPPLPSTSELPAHSTPSNSNLKSTHPNSPKLARRHVSPSLGFVSTFAGPSMSQSEKATSSPTVPKNSSYLLRFKILARSRSRILRMLGFGVVGILCIWIILGGEKRSKRRDRLKTRWWKDPNTNVTLLPQPSIPPPSTGQPPPIIISHTSAEISRLASASTSSAPYEWSALLLLSTPSQFAHLPSLLKSTLHQTVPPTHILILSPQGLHQNLKAMETTTTSFASYPVDQPLALAVIATRTQIYTDYTLVVEGNSRDLDAPSYAENLLYAMGTREYAAALLSSNGITLPAQTGVFAPNPHIRQSHSSSGCLASPILKSSLVHFPSTPFLLETTWLQHLGNGLRTDLPLEAALALNLWNKRGIPSFVIPMLAYGNKLREQKCKDLSKSIEGEELKLGQLFRKTRGTLGQGIRPEGNREDSTNGSTEASNLIVVLLSGDSELQHAYPLICGLAGRHEVRLYLADSDIYGTQVYFPSSKTTPMGSPSSTLQSRCHLDIIPIRYSPTTHSISDFLDEEFRQLRKDKVSIVLYLADGERATEFEATKSRRALGLRQGRRRARVGTGKETDDGVAVYIGLSKRDIGAADWMAALTMEGLRHWHTPRIDISVITNNRPTSLLRLLGALQNAQYFGDDVSLTVNLEQTADRATQRLVDDFDWEFGRANIRHRIILGGLMPAIVESWYPSSNDSYGVFLEDDVEVSPYFYSWLKFSILHYRYSSPQKNQSSRLFGISLYQQRNIELRPDGRQPFDAHKLFESLSLPPTLPYLSQIPCSWGAIYFPEVWREFHSYLALRLSEIALPISDSIVPEIRSNRWPRSWKKYFIELVYLRGYVMLYPNYENFRSFSTNHLEKGTHIHVEKVDDKRRAQFEVPLMRAETGGSLLDLQAGVLPSWDVLPIIDLWGEMASEGEIIERGWQTSAALGTCEKRIKLEAGVTYEARELLCRKEWDRNSVKEELVLARPLVQESRSSEVKVETQSEVLPLERIKQLEPTTAERITLGLGLDSKSSQESEPTKGKDTEPQPELSNDGRDVLKFDQESGIGKMVNEDGIDWPDDDEEEEEDDEGEEDEDDDDEWYEEDEEDEDGQLRFEQGELVDEKDQVAPVAQVPTGLERYEVELEARGLGEEKA